MFTRVSPFVFPGKFYELHTDCCVHCTSLITMKHGTQHSVFLTQINEQTNIKVHNIWCVRLGLYRC